MTTQNLVLLHNPRCSKSRETLALLTSNRYSPEIREYLKSPLSEDELRTLIDQLQTPLSALLRVNDARKLGFAADGSAISEDSLVTWLHKHPQTMQRPIAIYKDRAIIGRPPENVMALFAST